MVIPFHESYACWLLLGNRHMIQYEGGNDSVTKKACKCVIYQLVSIWCLYIHLEKTRYQGGLTARCMMGMHKSNHVNTLRPRQDGHHFPDDILKWIFINENLWISLKISLKFVRKVRINNIPTLVQIMAWRRPGDKPLSDPMMVKFTDAYMHHSAPYVARTSAAMILTM